MKKIVIALLLVVVLIVTLLVFYILNKPSKEMSEAEKQAAIAKILGRKPNLTTKNIPTGDIEFKGKYITFMYPAAGIERKQLLNGQVIPYTGLELFIFVLDSPKLTASAEVIESPKNVANINDYPNVRSRQVQANIYNQSDLFAGNIKGLAFSKQDQTGFEKTGFFLLSNKVYSFSVTGADSKAAGELFNKIINSLKFL